VATSTKHKTYTAVNLLLEGVVRGVSPHLASDARMEPGARHACYSHAIPVPNPDRGVTEREWAAASSIGETRHGPNVLASSGLTNCAPSPQLSKPSSLSNGGMNLREALPYLGGASYLGVLPKVNAETDAIETNRTRPARIPLSRRAKVQQTATA